MQFQVAPPNPKRRSKNNIFPEKYHLELQKSTSNFKSQWTHSINELQLQDVLLEEETNTEYQSNNYQSFSLEKINDIYEQKSAIIYNKFVSYKQKSNEIPKQVFMCWSTLDLPSKMKEVFNKNKELNPDFTFYLYDDNMCREFIQNHFENDVLYTFDKLIPGAYKADLWRLCVLFIKGGIYIDIKYECINEFTFANMIDKEYLTLDIPSSYWTDTMHGIYNAFMICKPNNNYLWKCISKLVDNVKNEYYGKSCLFPTGPGLLGDIYFEKCNTEQELKDKIKNDFDCVFSTNIKNIIFRNTPILEIYPEYRQEQHNVDKSYYSVLWGNHQIYDLNLKSYVYDKYPIKSNYNSIIPLKIYQTWYTTDLSEILQDSTNKLKEQNPEFEFYLYDDNDCREFIQNHFDISVVNAFNILIPGAYKADLFRYCILYIQGGIYIDIKYFGINGFKFIALTEKEYFVRDIESSESGIYNALMICKSGNLLLWKAIQKIVENVSTNYYGNHTLEPTGPILLKNIISENESEFNIHPELFHREIYSSCGKDEIPDKLYSTNYFIYYLNHPILTFTNKYRDLQKEYSKTKNKKPYYILWNEKQIYNNLVRY